MGVSVKPTVVIPARYDSRRLPGKALADLGGVPMVVRVMRQVMRARDVEGVVVATDDDRIEDAVRRHGGTVIRTRSDHVSGTDRVSEAADRLGLEHVINVQGDEPLLDPEAVDLLAAAMSAGRAPVITAAVPLVRDADNTARVKVVTDKQGMAMYFSRSPIPIGGPWQLHVGMYGFTREALRAFSHWTPGALERSERLEQLRFLENGTPICVVQVPESGPSVDTPEDLAHVAEIVRAQETVGE